jgi:hypothetical protein
MLAARENLALDVPARAHIRHFKPISADHVGVYVSCLLEIASEWREKAGF